MTLDQVYDELYGEIDQLKNELKNTLAQIQYASNFTEGVPLGTLSVGSESSQVIAPHVALLPGAESGMMILDLPVGTESAMPVLIQDDPEATELVPDAIPTGETVESVLNSNLMVQIYKGASSTYTFNADSGSQYLIVQSDGSNCAIYIVTRKSTSNAGIATIFNNNPSAYSATVSINSISVNSSSYGFNLTIYKLM